MNKGCVSPALQLTQQTNDRLVLSLAQALTLLARVLQQLLRYLTHMHVEPVDEHPEPGRQLEDPRKHHANNELHAAQEAWLEGAECIERASDGGVLTL